MQLLQPCQMGGCIGSDEGEGGGANRFLVMSLELRCVAGRLPGRAPARIVKTDDGRFLAWSIIRGGT